MPKPKRCGKHLRGSVDCLSHQMHQDRSDASIGPTHWRFDGAVRRAQPAEFPHDPSARLSRLRQALAGSTALVAVALAVTLLVAVTPVFAEGGRGGDNAGTGPGGPGGLDQPTSTGDTGFAGTD